MRRNSFDLWGLKGTARLELAYVLQCRHDERGAPTTPRVMGEVTELLRSAGVSSLLDRPLERWLADLARVMPDQTSGGPMSGR